MRAILNSGRQTVVENEEPKRLGFKLHLEGPTHEVKSSDSVKFQTDQQGQSVVFEASHFGSGILNGASLTTDVSSIETPPRSPDLALLVERLPGRWP